MKKIIITLIMALFMSAGASAVSLKEAFAALSNLPDVEIKAPDYNLPVVADVVKDGKIAAAYNLDRQKIFETGNAAYAILNMVPLSYMINGANNNEVAAFVYAAPNDSGSNDILIAVMSGYRGSVVFIYGTVDDASKLAIQNAELRMQGSFLTLEAENIPDVGDFNIIINKAR